MSDPTEIVKCWKNHFNDIYTPGIASNDLDFSEVVKSTVKEACAPCDQVLGASVYLFLLKTLFIFVVNLSVIQIMGMTKYMMKIHNRLGPH